MLLILAVLLFVTNVGADEFGNAQRRGCAEIARAFLAQLRMPIDPPRVFVTVPIKHPGWFDSGLVFIRNDRQDDCGVFVHEFVHAWQYQTRGPAQSDEEWMEREREAVRVERRWRGE